ncbi:DDE superfamily endonuclease domain-containing protein [Phanerochaete sordida]|uniref:DDE superfamily endonuclease domain-containing protein n=1 Tax=Phanerochaete sordida TaxID=48140 RepID=A0A9P3GSS9_9APHY|nr:DDE superfamily endonuclease domain-containing protein [Phanerochaete sordida]
MRKATRAAQKLPVNAQDQCLASFCRIALAIRDYKIPAELLVNIDQAQVVLQDTCGRTYETIGSSQVNCLGVGEKRAFTILAGVSASGQALPFQAIWKGKTKASLPSPKSPGYAESQAVGIRFESSKTDTYWSTHETMCSYMTNILVPYFSRMKAELGLPSDQECILLFDVWSGHRSRRFLDWMEKTYPWIIISFVPGGCTGIWQPCDVGIQRLLKLAIRREQHEHVVTEVRTQLRAGATPEEIRINTDLPVLRNRSVMWLVSAYRVVADDAVVKKAWSGCRLDADPELNLSHESLTSRKALQLLQRHEREESELWKELKPRKCSSAAKTKPDSEVSPPGAEEDAFPDESTFADYPDPTIPWAAIKQHLCSDGTGELPAQYIALEDGTIVSLDDGDVLDEDWSDASDVGEYVRDDDPPTDPELEPIGDDSASEDEEPILHDKKPRLK